MDKVSLSIAHCMVVNNLPITYYHCQELLTKYGVKDKLLGYMMFANQKDYAMLTNFENFDVITFGGTWNYKQTIDNLRITKVENTHKGWYESAKWFQGRIDIQKDKTTYITGFSRGAILAWLFCEKIDLLNYMEMPDCYIFGAPKACSELLHNVTIYHVKSYVLGYDPIPKLPPRLLNYHNFFVTKHIKTPWWHRLSPWVDHKPENYYKAFFKKEQVKKN